MKLLTHFSSRQSGVALVVTLILLAIITTLAIAFVALTHRETATVAATSATTDAELATEAGFQRAKGEILARLIAGNSAPNANGANPIGPEMMVSVAWDTNRLQNTSVLQPDLYRDPSPPVYVRTNQDANLILDSRHFLDLNQNRYFDETGQVPETLGSRSRPTARFDEVNPPQFNWVVGDPQWIGILADSNARHSAGNRFVSRYAWIVLPAGRSLDINTIHNQALRPDTVDMRASSGGDGYHRHQGVGPWEFNLAAFLADLNAGMWGGGEYRFDPTLPPGAGRALGASFADAREILRFRYTPTYYPGNPAAVADLLNPPTTPQRELDWATAYFPTLTGPDAALSQTNGIDIFAEGNFYTGPLEALTATRPWPGARNKRNFHTPHDLLNTAKIQYQTLGFIPRLAQASATGNTYDRYSFYRLLSQMGTDSAPEDGDKLNVNYVNVRSWSNPKDRLQTSDLISWSTRNPQFVTTMGRKGPELFFLSAVRRMLLEDGDPVLTNFVPVLSWKDYDLPGWPTNSPVLDANHPLRIPVFANGVNLYSGRVHQILQMAANLYDATRGVDTDPRFREDPARHAGMFPTVFRPRFGIENNVVYIVDYRMLDPDEDTPARITGIDQNGAQSSAGLPWNDFALGQLPSGQDPDQIHDILAYNIPVIVGARKGFPSFNEFASRTSFMGVRRLDAFKELGKTGIDNVRFTETFNLYITNDFGFEAWNSYSNAYPRPLMLYMTNIAFIDVGLSNATPTRYFSYSGRTAIIPAWKKNRPDTFDSFLASNFPPRLVFAVTNVSPISASGPNHPWTVSVRNQLKFFLIDQTANRLVDAVTLSVTNDFFDAGYQLTQSWEGAAQASQIWTTGPVSGRNWREGVEHQLNISQGFVGLSEVQWKNFGPLSQNRTLGIQSFNYFLQTPEQTTTQVPFVPSRVVTQTNHWRANDPLVHYTPEDLWRGSGYASHAVRPVPSLNLGERNPDSLPWPEPDTPLISDKNPSIRDPGIRTSDQWDFPTSKVPSVGMLGRVHRGTPWQTVYFKADATTTNAFGRQSGRPLIFTAAEWNRQNNPTRPPSVSRAMWPTNDWRLLDVFTASVHPQAARSRLSINQTNLAAWSAALSGVALRSVTQTNEDGIVTYGANDYTVVPASLYDAADAHTWEVNSMVTGLITNLTGRTYRKLSDLLSVPQFSYLSSGLTNADFNPYAPAGSDYVYDSDYESLPEKLLGLLSLGTPRYVIYSWGQSLKPAEYGVTGPDADGNVKPSGASVVTSGSDRGLVRNYQITGEVATRAVVHVEFERMTNNIYSPLYNVFDYSRPRMVVDSFTALPQE